MSAKLVACTPIIGVPLLVPLGRNNEVIRYLNFVDGNAVCVSIGHGYYFGSVDECGSSIRPAEGCCRVPDARTKTKWGPGYLSIFGAVIWSRAW